jgi:xanthine phosphoribosyltransferase
MKELEEKILKEGKLLGGDIVKVGSFLNQQVDIDLLKKMAKNVTQLFNVGVTKVLTIEASGIPFACAIAWELNVPFVFAKKTQSANVSGDMLSAKVFSFTHKTENEIIVPKDYLSKTDVVLIADDFLANGEALRGLIEIVEKSGATLAGCCVQIEKAFQNGGNTLREKGYRVESLASIKEITNNTIKFN